MTPKRKQGMGSHHSATSDKEEWLTPPMILEALGGAQSFDLDPCAPIVRPWPMARAHYTVKDNGLLKRWHGRVWCNPPYSTAIIGKWLARLNDHGTGTALIFARTETENFFRYVWQGATALLFIEGRLFFHHVDGREAEHNAGAPSVLAAYGPRDAERLADSGLHGQFVPLLLPRSFAIAALPATETWREVVAAFMQGRGPVRLDELYRAVAAHAKTHGRPHWREKVRQALQRGPFERVRAGLWVTA